jgi:hypothetical protein
VGRDEASRPYPGQICLVDLVGWVQVQWQDHELGSYPTIALLWEDAMRGTPWNYLERWRVALTAYENGGELPPGWSMPPVRSQDDDSDSVPFDPDKAPPDRPEALTSSKASAISANSYSGPRSLRAQTKSAAFGRAR